MNIPGKRRKVLAIRLNENTTLYLYKIYYLD